MRRKVEVRMEDAGGRVRPFVGTVTEVGICSKDGADQEHSDYMLVYFQSRRPRTDSEMLMRKAEVATSIAEMIQAHAEESDEWIRYDKLRKYRFVVFSHFMIDLQA